MHIKSFYTQQHCYVSLKTWRDSNPGLLVPEADVMSIAPRRQGAIGTLFAMLYYTSFFAVLILFRARTSTVVVMHMYCC
jgi:hypothetical protein